jgi:hypothetical protein
MRTAPPEAREKLRALHETYAALVNQAVAANRYRLAEELALEYDTAALRLLENDTPDPTPLAHTTLRHRPPLADRLRSVLRGGAAA